MENTMLVSINNIDASQTKGTSETLEAWGHFLDYTATHLDYKIINHSSGMILHVRSDSSFLSVANNRSRARGFVFLSNKRLHTDKASINAPVHITCTIFKIYHDIGHRKLNIFSIC